MITLRSIHGNDIRNLCGFYATLWAQFDLNAIDVTLIEIRLRLDPAVTVKKPQHNPTQWFISSIKWESQVATGSKRSRGVSFLSVGQSRTNRDQNKSNSLELHFIHKQNSSDTTDLIVKMIAVYHVRLKSKIKSRCDTCECRFDANKQIKLSSVNENNEKGRRSVEKTLRNSFFLSLLGTTDPHEPNEMRH